VNLAAQAEKAHSPARAPPPASRPGKVNRLPSRKNALPWPFWCARARQGISLHARRCRSTSASLLTTLVAVPLMPSQLVVSVLEIPGPSKWTATPGWHGPPLVYFGHRFLAVGATRVSPTSGSSSNASSNSNQTVFPFTHARQTPRRSPHACAVPQLVCSAPPLFRSFYKHWRLLALDAPSGRCPTPQKTASAFGSASDQQRAAFPQLRVAALCEYKPRHHRFRVSARTTTANWP